jgi:hypothetical protein
MSVLNTCPVHGHNDCLCGKTPKVMHQKAMSTLDANAPQLLKKLGEVMRENEELKKRMKDLENESRNVPLCGHHAEIWFCHRHFKEGDCWFCNLEKQLPKQELKVELIERPEYPEYSECGIHHTQR